MSSIQTANSVATDHILGEPAWQIAHLFPVQGNWSEDDYLALDDAGRLVELSDGCVEVLPRPTAQHQRIVVFLLLAFERFLAASKIGEVLCAPLPVRLWPGKLREPDLVVRTSPRSEFRGRPEGADLVVEVVSEGDENRRRDLIEKPLEYARAGINEYWIVDPQLEQISILVLDGSAYRVHAVHRAGDMARSTFLQGFEVSVDEVLAAAAGRSR